MKTADDLRRENKALRTALRRALTLAERVEVGTLGDSVDLLGLADLYEYLEAAQKIGITKDVPTTRTLADRRGRKPARIVRKPTPDGGR